MRKLNSDLSDSSVILGQGYSTDKGMPVLIGCFAGHINSTGGGSTIINFDNAISFEELQSALNVDITTSVGFGPFSGSVSADYARTISEDRYSQSFYYYAKSYMPTQVWYPDGYGTKMLNDVGTGVYAQGSEAFRLACGDQIVTEVKEGVGLYVAMKIEFSSYFDKQTFQAHVSGGFGSLLDVSASVQKVVTEYSVSGDVGITAFQQGGDPILLPKIFEKDAGGYYITSCTLSSLDDCKDTINGILDYATNLPSQVTPTNGELLDYSYISLIDYGVNTGNTTVTPEVMQARQWLGETYLNQTEQSVFASHLLSSPYMTATCVESSILNELNTQNNNLQTNLVALRDSYTGVAACYNDPMNCIQTEQSIQQSLLPRRAHEPIVNGR